MFTGDDPQILNLIVTIAGVIVPVASVGWAIFAHYNPPDASPTKDDEPTKGAIIDALGKMAREEREPLFAAIDALYRIRREKPEKAEVIDGALALLKTGDTSRAEEILRADLDEKKRIGRKALKEAAAAARHLAAFIYLHDTHKALASHQEAVRLDPEEPDGWLQLGRVALRAGDSEALRAFRELDRRAREQGRIRWRAIAHSQLGDMDELRGASASALNHYQQAQSLLEQWAALALDDPQRQRDLSVSFDRIGDIYLANGDGAKALAAFQEGLVIARKLTELDPANTDWRRDLSVSFDRIGDIYLANGDDAKALAAYQEGLAIRKRLTELDPARVQWKTDLVVSYVRMAGMETDKERQAGWFRQALEILRPLAAENRLSADRMGWIGLIERELDGVQPE